MRDKDKTKEQLINELTQMRQRIAELEAVERDFRTLLDNANLIVVGLDQKGKITYANPYLLQLTGYTLDQVMGQDWFQTFIPARDRPAVGTVFHELMTSNYHPYYENSILTRDGKERLIVWNNTLLLDEQEQLVGTMSIGEDITERKRVEEQIHRRNQELTLLNQAIEQITESVVITDSQGTILYVNPAFEQLTGYSQAEAIGQNPSLLKNGEQDTAIYQEMWATISAGEVWDGYLSHKNKKDGALYTVDTTITPIRDESGAIVNYVGVQRDVTRELQLEKQYHQAQKMEAIGRLAGGVAHDFNNLLTSVMGYAGLTLRKLSPDDPARCDIKSIQKTAELAANLTHQLLAFSRKQTLQLTVLDLNEVVTDMEKMLRRLIGEDIELTTILASGDSRVKADQGQLGQVIMNLAVNARDAMPWGGKLTIETANVMLDEEYARQHVNVQPGPYVMLAVSDTGAGMDEETRSQIFEPFFTTKAKGKGTGLGLATVYGIVKQSGGDIWVYSEPGLGTTFKIYLPCVAEVAAPSRPRPRDQADIPTGSETILLVEDNAEVRDLVRCALQWQGYTVLEAQDGQAALQAAADHNASIHLLLSDVVMPGLSGQVMIEQLSQIQPNLKILFMSGYTYDTIAHHEVSSKNGVAFLQKPFSFTTLTRKVREVLDAA